MSNVLKKAYDNTPYISSAFPNYSLSRLIATRKLLALDSVKKLSKNPRVLEIGCGFGGNIFASAITHQNATFWGVDLSSSHIAGASEIAHLMGLKNTHFLELDISSPAPLIRAISGGKNADIEAVDEEQKFDFIYCHGVYSWVPGSVKEAILSNAQKLLKKDGIFVVSYNVYPGWKHIDIVRELMCFGADGGGVPGGDLIEIGDTEMLRLKRAKTAVQTLKNAIDNGLASRMPEGAKTYINKILDGSQDDYYLVHEFLEYFNEPCYFRDFAKSANKAGLTHLIDSEFLPSYQHSAWLLDPSFERLNRIAKEQWGDFLSLRQFRHSVLTHTDSINAAIELAASGSVQLDDLDEIYVSGVFKKENDGQYTAKDGKLKIDAEAGPVLDAIDAAYPKMLRSTDIAKKIDMPLEKIRQIVGRLISLNALHLSSQPFECVPYNKNKSHLAPKWRAYFEFFKNTPIRPINPANSLHQNIPLTCEEAGIALLFDGQNSLTDIAKEIYKGVQSGNSFSVVTPDGTIRSITDPKEVKEASAQYATELAKKLELNGYLEKM